MKNRILRCKIEYEDGKIEYEYENLKNQIHGKEGTI